MPHRSKATTPPGKATLAQLHEQAQRLRTKSAKLIRQLKELSQKIDASRKR